MSCSSDKQNPQSDINQKHVDYFRHSIDERPKAQADCRILHGA